MEEKNIEIPFGALDSELGGFEYTIPEGYEAEIKDGKVIVKEKESEDEKIRKEIKNFFSRIMLGQENFLREDYDWNAWIAWLEKQGQTFTKKDIDDAWLEGMCDAKHELEKQGENSPILSNSSNIGKNWQNPAWSEEDELMFTSIIQTLKLTNGAAQMKIDWLKSLKDRYTWRPSDKQMKALNTINLTGCISYAEQEQTLIELYKQLKKLKR